MKSFCFLFLTRNVFLMFLCLVVKYAKAAQREQFLPCLYIYIYIYIAVVLLLLLLFLIYVI